MKLRKEFLVHNSGSESFLIPSGSAGFSGMIRGNRTLGIILELLQTDTTEAELTAALRARFDDPDAPIEADVAKALTELRKVGAIDE